MSALPKLSFTPEEYLDLEDQADYKSEYFYGEIFAMAGTQPAHNQIVGAVIRALGRRFQGRDCDTFFMDIRLRAAEGNLYTYPDVMALCGEPRFERKGRDVPSLLNPQVIVEVLSPSTQDFDRNEKFRGYRKIETLTDYLLVATDERRVEQHTRLPNGIWTREDHSDWEGSSVRLASLECDLPLMEIYDKVSFAVR